MDNKQIYVGLVIGTIVFVTLIKVICQIYICKRKRRSDNMPLAVRSTMSIQQVDSSINEFGPANYYANARYSQEDRWFQFMYRRVDGEWFAYILRMPSFNGRDEDLHITHRYRDDETYWICYDPQPRSLEGAKSVSRAWADRELEYISTGKLFEEQKW